MEKKNITEYKALSKKVKSLLTREEDEEVDWKKSLTSLDPEDIVAFANSKNGGTILIGVEEFTDSEGKQKPNIVGCTIGDTNKMRIQTKAQNCIPPIEVIIIAENVKKEPFYRVEIPSGDKKPYCTSKGIYKIRDDGNNKAITPDKLLSIFIEAESEIFLKRFKTAAKELEDVLYDSYQEINEVKSSLENMLPQIEELQEYSFMSDEILGTVNKIEDYVVSTEITTGWNEKRILALLKHFDIEDPYVTNLENTFKDHLIMLDEFGRNIYEKDYLEKISRTFTGATKDQLKQWYNEVIEELKSKKLD
jgi:hypothetical protein